MTEKEYEILGKYVPEASLPILKRWFEQRFFLLKITQKRTTKLGDFRHAFNGKPCRISVNGNLNKYSFLITLTHEFAHLLVWDKHQNEPKSHGKEWKTEFAKLMHVHLQRGVFPPDLEKVLIKHLQNPPASSQVDMKLVETLKKYNNTPPALLLKEIPEGAIFALENKRMFKKMEKRRTRILCEEVATKKRYLIHCLAEVIVLPQSK
ncbi:MAG: sprT domain-containing protein [Bacteroidetes bacterium HGW-Bacteroidetes-12]|nr:MAG: sprT domain-containing protein [Bacteroidetes bacterium HGW-Bacteroidetes-12]